MTSIAPTIANIYELSPVQQGLLFHSLYTSNAGMYTIQFCCTLHGNLQPHAFAQAWQQAIAHHPILRTAFHWQELEKPLQVVYTQVEFPWEQQDWRHQSAEEQQQHWETFLQTERSRGFTLNQAPLMRLTLIRLAETTYRVVWSKHHLLLDGWSTGLVLRDVLAAYTALCQGRAVTLPQRPDYSQYIAWLQQQSADAAEAFWRPYLKGLTAPTSLNLGRVSSASTPSVAEPVAETRVTLSAATTAALQTFVRTHQMTFNTLLQGAWALLLSHYSREEVMFGVTVSGRSADLAAIDQMVGVLINTLPLRVQVPPQANLLTWLRQIQTQQAELRQYEASSLVDVQSWSDVPRGVPLFDSILVVENYPLDASVQAALAQQQDLSIQDVLSIEQTHYPLTIIAELRDGVSFRLLYDPQRLPDEAIARLSHHWLTLLDGIAANPHRCLNELPWLTPAERQQLLVEWNQTQVAYQPEAIHRLIEAQVARSPQTLAVIFEQESLTYEQLNQRASQLAHYLQVQGVAPDGLVGVYLHRSVDLVVALLAILKAGGAYVPLDPEYPRSRLAFLLDDTQVPMILTHQTLVETLPDHSAQVVCLDDESLAIASYPQSNPSSPVTPNHLAYVIYTSGSTGQPKGVMNTHKGLCNRLLWMQSAYPLTVGDRVLQKTPFSFDVSVWEFFWTLITGATLVVARPGGHRDSGYLVQLIAQQQITTLHFVPSMLRVFLDEPGLETCQSLKRVICSGEALSLDLQQRCFERLPATLHNLYGPTEAAIDVTFWDCQRHDCQHHSELLTVPIGRPIANTQIYLLDANLHPVPVGVPGELYIGGDGLARGYLNRADLTQERFIPHPFSPDPQARLYRTGDLARYLTDGAIEFLGRIDYQVKIRGYRIELEEIEAVLMQHPEVQATAVIAHTDESGDQRLIAYVVPGVSLSLRAFLQAQLPDYMVPSAFVPLAALPLTPSGKLDRAALSERYRRSLPEPQRQTDEEQAIASPSSCTPLEEMLVSLWSQVLNQPTVGIHQNFFELGGHSLRATQLVSRIRDTLQVELPLRSLFEHPTIAGLAVQINALLQTRHSSTVPALTPVERPPHIPLSFAQQRLWFQHQLDPDRAAYHLSAAVRLRGELNVAALQQSFEAVIQRHEVLRTRFRVREGNPIQEIVAAVQLPFALTDLQSLPEGDREAEVQCLSTAIAQTPFNLEQPPLLRLHLLQLSQTEHVLLLTLHHIIADAWSMGVLIQEIKTHYQPASPPSSLPPLPLQYADFALWQRQWLQGEVLHRQLDYWKQRLQGSSPMLQLPMQSSSPIAAFQDGTCRFQLSPSLTAALRSLSRQQGVTLFMTLLAAFQTLLYRYTQQDDLVVGTDVANRTRQATEGLIGFFVNLLVLRTDLSGNPSFSELLQRVREVTLAAYAHQDVPFEKLVEALRPDRQLNQTPLFQVLFVLQNAPMPSLELPGLVLEPLAIATETTKFDLALFLQETEQGIAGIWRYNAALFSPDLIEQMTQRLDSFLNQIVAQPDTRLNRFELLTDVERKQQVMDKTEQKARRLQQFMQVKPKAVSVSPQELVRADLLGPGQTLPLLLQPALKDLDVIEWTKTHRDLLDTNLLKHGGILLRGFNTPTVKEFEAFAQTVCSELFAEYGDLPREGVSGKVYGSTPYPADQAILFHHESSHLHRWPQKIFFYCVQPAQQGGETPIADARRAYQLLSPELRDRFLDKQLRYIRNYTRGLDVSWQDFFQTRDRAVVEAYCRQAGIEWEWRPNDGLRTVQVRPAIAQHPKTGEWLFFNQILLHHLSCLEPAVQDSLLSLFGADNLPRQVEYGDGTPMEAAVVDEIQAIYQQVTVQFPWQQGDILLLDNMLTAHSRAPFVGPRKIVVAMGELQQASSLAQQPEVAHAN
jgi:amino acid adenylation domain-containing protein